MKALAFLPATIAPLRLIAGALLVAASAALITPDRLLVGCALGWTLLILSLIDLAEGILPNRLTYPLLAAGLVASGIGWRDSLMGAAIGAALLALPALAYRRLRGVDGLGWGDVKLAAGAGAWLGWQEIPPMILIAALLGIAAVLLRRWLARVSADETIPFGPALAAATWILWLVRP